jgi:hypothetical protein
MAKSADKQQMNFKIDPRLVERLREATEKDGENPYAPTMTQIVERGLELALEERNKKKRS